MDQRAAVRISVQLRAQLFLEDGAAAHGGEVDGSAGESGHGGGDEVEEEPLARRALARRGAVERVGSTPRTCVALVEDLSRNGVFLRTTGPIALGTAVTVQLELPDEALELHGHVVRIEQGARSGVAVQLNGSPATRRSLANFLMRCHAQGY